MNGQPAYVTVRRTRRLWGDLAEAARAGAAAVRYVIDSGRVRADKPVAEALEQSALHLDQLATTLGDVSGADDALYTYGMPTADAAAIETAAAVGVAAARAIGATQGNLATSVHGAALGTQGISGIGAQRAAAQAMSLEIIVTQKGIDSRTVTQQRTMLQRLDDRNVPVRFNLG